MFDSPLIEVGIGLSLVFLLLGLLVSAVCEMLAGLFKWRAQYLWAGLETLLQSPEARERLYQHPLIKGLSSMPAVARPVTGALHKLGLTMGGGPSYIPSRTFALALLDVIREPHAIARDIETGFNRLIAHGTRNPSALAASIAQLINRLDGESLTPELRARLQQLHDRIFAPVDPAVVNGLTRQVEAVLSVLPTSAQGSLAPVAAWLEQAHRAGNYVELRAALVDALSALPTTTPAARECRAALDAIVARFSLGSPEEMLLELQRFVDASSDVRHAIGQAGASLSALAGSLAPLLEDAAGDVERFRTNIEAWFNDGMDRVSGAYKRHTLAWQAVIGLGLAIALNVDTLQITRSLWHDQALREMLVAQAESVAREERVPSGTAAEQFNALRSEIGALGLPIGWRGCAAAQVTTADGKAVTVGTPHLWCDGWSIFAVLPMLLGWCLTAAAVSLGAPFWFDTLKRFVSIRSAGKAPEERPMPPKAVPQPRDAGQTPPA